MLLLLEELRIQNLSIAPIEFTKSAEITVLLKYPSNFWKSLEFLIINFEINIKETSSENCIISSDAAAIFQVTDAKY